MTPEACPNGAVGNVAGVCSEGRNVVGLMPHPEHAVERQVGFNTEDGLKLFRSAQAWLRRARGPEAERPALVPGP